jgi:hypothetical protein
MQDQKIKIAGRSGCKVELLKSAGREIVRKSSARRNYNRRLAAQCSKQRLFQSESEYFRPFTAPLVYRQAVLKDGLKNNELFWFEMEFIPGEKYSEYLERSTLDQLEILAGNFIRFIKKEISLAEIKKCDPLILTDKLTAIKAILSKRNYSRGIFFDNIRHLSEHIPDYPLPLGLCHGDFTLSNTLYFAGNIYMIDFLDSFLESPLLDIVKLRQDTKFYWSLLVDTEILPYQRNKIIQVLRYFDQKLVQAFGENPFYAAWYDYLEKLNLLRILPYLADPQEINFIETCLTKREV